MGNADNTFSYMPDVRFLYAGCCNELSDDKNVILVELFYTPILISGQFT